MGNIFLTVIEKGTTETHSLLQNVIGTASALDWQLGCHWVTRL